MVLYHIDFNVVAFPFGFSFLSLEVFWIDSIDLIDSTEKKSRKVLRYVQVTYFFGYSSRGGR